MQGDTSATFERITSGVFSDKEFAVGSRCPHILLIIVVLRGDDHFVGNQESRVETDTELTDHRHSGITGSHSLKEGCGES